MATTTTCQPLRLKPHRYPGVLVTFCGVDGSGKSSLIGGIEEACREAGLHCTRTFTPTRRVREDAVFRKLVDDPCGTSPSPSHRGAAVTGAARSRVSVLGLLLSIMGDLVQHTADTILPALERGDVVLCDRYVFTSQAEIGARSDLQETEPVLARIAEHILQPDLSFGLNVSWETSHRRVRARNDKSDQPPPRDFLARQVAAYRAVFEANGLVSLETERGLEETIDIAMSHVERAVLLAGPRSSRIASPRRQAMVAGERAGLAIAADVGMSM